MARGETQLAEKLCCSASVVSARTSAGLSRRGFLKGTALGAVSFSQLGGLTWAKLAAEDDLKPPGRKPLRVKPLLSFEIPERRAEGSWRNWGEIHTPRAVEAELGRIGQELADLKERADFPLEILPVSAVSSQEELASVEDLESADSVLLYAAGGWTDLLDSIAAAGKKVIVFVRHESGPVYLWYEIIHPRLIREHTDRRAHPYIGFEDVVVDDQNGILWRLRALCGLKNTLGSRVLAIGGAGGWSRGGRYAPQLAQIRWSLDIETLSYEELGGLIADAYQDNSVSVTAMKRASAYLADRGLKLETAFESVRRCFVLDHLFRALMASRQCGALTINECMGTIMEVSNTAACLTLSTLNDDGYLAFCESDFVAIPSGLLLAAISGRPVFLHNPTYPHEGRITLAHCTAPRRMDGQGLEPVRIVTHFESDYGAAPKVEFRSGQKVTIIDPDFAAERWLGFSAEIVDSPDLPICRSQLNVKYECDSARLAEEMRGFHWMLCYGDFTREVGYALSKTPIAWKCLV